jgi:molybdopterin synthase sulfur carrier subunit
MATVLIPAPLRKLTNNVEYVIVAGTTLKEVVENLDLGYPGIKDRICNEHEAIRTFVNVYLNNEDIRFKAGLNTEIKDTDEISIVPAIAGG